MRIDINNGWLWAEGFSEEMVKPSYEDSGIEVLGPSLADINGGMGGVYVRSTGVPGKASVKISLPDYDLSSAADLEVKVLTC